MSLYLFINVQCGFTTNVYKYTRENLKRGNRLLIK
nr:MAG TPA: hypothetical protein [Bacteriophage sp.]